MNGANKENLIPLLFLIPVLILGALIALLIHTFRHANWVGFGLAMFAAAAVTWMIYRYITR